MDLKVGNVAEPNELGEEGAKAPFFGLISWKSRMCGGTNSVFHPAPSFFCYHLFTFVSCDDFVFGENNRIDEVVPKQRDTRIQHNINAFLSFRKHNAFTDLPTGIDRNKQIGDKENEWKNHRNNS